MKSKNFQFFYGQGWTGLAQARELDTPTTLVLAFCAPMMKQHPHLLKEIRQAFPNSVVAGCSTSGEIHGLTISDESISCIAIKFEKSKVRLASQKITSMPDSFNVGQKLASELLTEDLRGIIVLSDGLNTNGSALVDGFNSVIDSKQTSLFGGLAADGPHFKSTWVIHQDEMQPQTVIAVGLYGADLRFETASKGGWDIFGPERTITKSIGNELFELDGKPALDLYKEYLGEKSKDLPASGLLFPIQIRDKNTPEERVVRTILAVNEESKSLLFAGDVPENSQAQLMKANFERLIDGSAFTAEQLQKSMERNLTGDRPDESVVRLAISCVGRRLVLGQRSEEEIETLNETRHKAINVIGFYSYGELSSVSTGEPCRLHNQSMTLAQIYEV